MYTNLYIQTNLPFGYRRLAKKLLAFGLLGIPSMTTSAQQSTLHTSHLEWNSSYMSVSWNGLLGANEPKFKPRHKYYLDTLNLNSKRWQQTDNFHHKINTTKAVSGLAPPAGAAGRRFQPAREPAASHVTRSRTTSLGSARVWVEASQLITWHTMTSSSIVHIRSERQRNHHLVTPSRVFDLLMDWNQHPEWPTTNIMWLAASVSTWWSISPLSFIFSQSSRRWWVWWISQFTASRDFLLSIHLPRLQTALLSSPGQSSARQTRQAQAVEN